MTYKPVTVSKVSAIYTSDDKKRAALVVTAQGEITESSSQFTLRLVTDPYRRLSKVGPPKFLDLMSHGIVDMENLLNRLS